MRILIPPLTAGYALKEQYSVIATAAHPKRVIRQSYYDIVRKNGAQVILLIFRVSDEQAFERIRKNDRHTAILDISPHGGTDFQDLFNKQKNILEEPLDDEKQSCFKVFEITESNTEDILESVIGLLPEEPPA